VLHSGVEAIMEIIVVVYPCNGLKQMTHAESTRPMLLPEGQAHETVVWNTTISIMWFGMLLCIGCRPGTTPFPETAAYTTALVLRAVLRLLISLPLPMLSREDIR